MKFQAFLARKECAEVIQTDFKSKLPAMEDEELDASTELEKAKKLAKMKNAMVMKYATQCLSDTCNFQCSNRSRLVKWKCGNAECNL